ncbi:amidohydrolase family protein [soil metagenome]
MEINDLYIRISDLFGLDERISNRWFKPFLFFQLTLMRFLSADYIFSAHTGFIKKGILVVDGNGVVQDLIDPEKTEKIPVAEKFEGIICPGFINAHCHLELSHLKGQIAPQTGFTGFAKELIAKRENFTKEEIDAAIETAEHSMFENGISGVGDISNRGDSFLQKEKRKILYHTFIELLALNPIMAEKVAAGGSELLRAAPKPNSLTPHAAFSVSPELMEIIGNSCHDENVPLSMHNQESRAEEEFFKKAKGPIREFYEYLGIDISFFKPTGLNSLRSTLKYLPHNRNIILVHNTFTSAEDISWSEFYSRKLYWCFCPNANLYIENALPDYQLFINAKAKIVVGTDSLASNNQLSILSELKVIAKTLPEITLEQLLTWSTKNGADALCFPSLGTFEKYKKPGVILLSGITNEKLLPETEVKRLI